MLDKPVRQRELLDCLARVYSADGRAAAGKSASAAARPSTSSSFLVTETRNAAPNRGLHILVAEDNQVTEHFVRAILRSPAIQSCW